MKRITHFLTKKLKSIDEFKDNFDSLSYSQKVQCPWRLDQAHKKLSFRYKYIKYIDYPNL